MKYKSVNPIMEIVTGMGENEGKMTVDILEVPTNQIIAADVEITAGKKMVRHLNFGGGFDGWTPPFFLERLIPSE